MTVIFRKKVKNGDIHRLKREASLLSKIPYHAGIVRYIGYQDLPSPRILLPHYPLGTIQPAGEAITLKRLLPIAQALEYLHKEIGLIHLDVKPANILLRTADSAILADFSHSLMMSDWQVNMGYGTLMFTSPEICAGHCVDPRAADVWALGMTTLVLLNEGKYPFENAVDLLTGMNDFRPPRLAVSSRTQNLIDSCLIEDPLLRKIIF